MAGDWIKVENATPNKPEILRIARILNISKDEAFGKAMRFWMWIDANSVDGVVDGVVSTDVDAVVECIGFADTLIIVHWLEIDESNEQVIIPNFDRHNGETAKRRALKNKRQTKWRQKRDENADTSASTGASTREEKRRDNILFDQFWSNYPRKESKKKAETTFNRLSKTKQQQAITDCQTRYEGTQKQFIPLPTSYLNAERWEDEKEVNGYHEPERWE